MACQAYFRSSIGPFLAVGASDHWYSLSGVRELAHLRATTAENSPYPSLPILWRQPQGSGPRCGEHSLNSLTKAIVERLNLLIGHLDLEGELPAGLFTDQMAELTRSTTDWAPFGTR